MKSRNGFTLVELLAVIIILGIVMTISAPMVLDAIKKGTNQVDKFNKQSLFDGVSLYLQDLDGDVIKYTNNTGSTITIAKNGHTYANGATLSPYDFKCYVIQNNGIDIKITDLVSAGYFDPNCDYSKSNNNCKLKKTCVLKGKIKYEVSHGYYVTTGYDASVKSGCVDAKTGKNI